MDIRSFSFTIRSERFAPLGGQEIAYADLDGSGSFDPKKDTTVFWQDENGGGLAQYSEIRQALTQLGGTASGQALAAHTGREDTRLEPAQVERPVVNGRFTLLPDGIRAEFEDLGSVPIIPPEGGNIATLDVNRDGVSEPQHDSMLELNTLLGGNTYRSMVSFEALQGAVEAAGGRLEEKDFTTGLASLAPPFEGKPSGIWFEESPQQFDPAVQRTLRLDGEGRLWMDYA